jgi:ferric-dicitrate binding protein FerR (iron transport regulator)
VVGDENETSWRTGKLIFRKTSLTEVARTLEHYFHISITINTEALASCRFTSSFDNPSLEEVIEAISLSMNVNVLRHQETYIIDGEGCGSISP